MLISPALQATIDRNGWHIVDDPLPARMDTGKGPDDLAAVDHVLTVERGCAVPTRIIIGRPNRPLSSLAASMREMLGEKEGVNLLICCPVEYPPHQQWIEESRPAFCLRYVRRTGEPEEDFWSRVLFPVYPFAAPIAPFLVFPGQRHEDRVVILTGWCKSTLCAIVEGSGVDVLDGPVDGLDAAVSGRQLRELAHRYACTGRPLVLSIRDAGTARYAARLFRAQGVVTGMYEVVPTESGIAATRS